MAIGKVFVTKKHKYPMGPPDAGGNRKVFVTGVITMGTGVEDSASAPANFVLDLSEDIKNIEGVFIQGDSGYVVQYDYSGKVVEVYVQGTLTEASTALTKTTASGLATEVFYFMAFGS